MRHKIARFTAPQIVAWWCRPHDTSDQAARAEMAIVLARTALRFAARRMPEQAKADRLAALAKEAGDLCFVGGGGLPTRARSQSSS